ncbi:MAG: DUF4058 family protein [Caldilineaceae bacterium]
MASPFPGMDPYLEDRNLWSGFHHALAEEIKALLNAQIGPKYYADVEVHTVFEEISIASSKTMYPDVGVFEPNLQPSATVQPTSGMSATNVLVSPAPVQRLISVNQTKLRSVRVYVTETEELVTSIELLSPYNKRGEGLREYRRKRAKIINSLVHLVEIDLLRGGQRPGREVNDPPLENIEYILLVNRSQDMNTQRLSEIWPVALNEVLPLLPIPLALPDPDAVLNVNVAIQSLYERSGYAWRIDYRKRVPPPSLRPAMAQWIEQLLTTK